LRLINRILKENRTMRNKNTILAAAITATLTIMNQAYALDATNFAGTSFTSDGGDTTGTISTTLAESEKGIRYGSHLFGSGNTPATLPSGEKAAVKYEVEGSIGFTFEFKATLSNGAKFSDANSGPQLVYNHGNSNASDDPSISGGSCGGEKECIWTVTLDANEKLNDGFLFYVLYQLTNTDALQDPGEKINLSATLSSTLSGSIATDKSVTVAQSEDPLDVEIEPGEDFNLRISVSSNNTEFVTTATDSEELLSANDVVIGYLRIQNNTDVHGVDGTTNWDLGLSNNFEAGFDEGNNLNTALTITSGQFNASITGSSGSVYIGLPGESGGTISTNSNKIEATSVTSTTATWELSDTDLQAITANSSTTQRPVIVIETDGTNAVNLEENPPEATLTIDYKDYQQDITYGPTELADFRQDGTTCWVYNVPPPSSEGVADVMNLRITNDSASVSGEILGTLYPMNGDTTSLTNPIFSGINLLGEGVELGAYQTVRITADDIAALGGDTPYVWWEDGGRRGSLLISTTLPKLEILVLMRDGNTGIVSNLSTGASGFACQN
jgi:hypothetical protein